jgi:hypothetical protein
VDERVVSSDVVHMLNILSTAPQLSISQKALGKLPEDGNVLPKYVGATIHNTSQHDFAVKWKIGYFKGNRCPESENGASFLISRLVLAKFCYFSIYNRKM